ncbi:MAG TPA: NAD(P)/FAD-dependent oxidoreductase, partial [Clostridiaceae bacterium]|nr:NAD(P)/FAD-dependent oxidoreductase [Clostridiaceae bacterium]
NKARFNIRGNRMMDKVARELDIPFKRKGSMVLAFNKDDMEKLNALYEKGLRNGVEGMDILTASEVRKKEPNISEKVTGALYASSAGIICPYELTISAAENAVENGVDLILECEVSDIKRSYIKSDDEGKLLCRENDNDSKDNIHSKNRNHTGNSNYTENNNHAESVNYCRNSICSGNNKLSLTDSSMLYKIVTSQGEFKARYVVNCAGLYADTVAAMVGDTSFTINPRKGEYILFDKRQGKIVNSIIFQTPTRMGKGILVTQTVDGNLLIGPNAVDIDDKTDISTSNEGLKQVMQGALKSVPDIDRRNIITSFTGLRAVPSTGDFIIKESGVSKGFINVAGIESPGLTAAPAIAEYVEDILRKAGLVFIPKNDYNPVRRPVKRFRDMKEDELADLLKKNPLYGRIVCRCEKVSAAEIIDSIRRPAGARNLDGVKRRTRAGMGRCQGGFCTPRVMEILSKELNIPIDEITKSGGDSWMLAGRTK